MPTPDHGPQPPPTLYAVLRDLSAAMAEVESLEAALERATLTEAQLADRAYAAMQGHDPEAAYLGPDGSRWAIIDDEVTRLKDVDAMTVVVPVGVEPPKDESIAVRPVADNGMPFRHRPSCLCPSCLEVRENVSSFVG